MNVLGIETSCDDTSIAIINSDRQILSHITYSQVDEHMLYGGVVPEIAARSHFEKIGIVFEKVLSESNLSSKNIDVIAATSGPGLIGGVLVGSMFAKGLAYGLKKPFVAVNHLEGHVLSTFIENENIQFPFLKLLVSGGHCQVIMAKALGSYKLVSSTIDDAPGEAFDKVARMLGLGYPGGRIIEEKAEKGDPDKYKFPIPLLKDKKNFNFSFSGLKTSVRNKIEELSELTEKQISDICASFQNAVVKALTSKLGLIMDEYAHENKIISVAGGVAANKKLRNAIKELCESKDFDVVFPSVKYCTDNGAMIALAGLMRAEQNKFDDLSFSPRSRWPLEDLE